MCTFSHCTNANLDGDDRCPTREAADKAKQELSDFYKRKQRAKDDAGVEAIDALPAYFSEDEEEPSPGTSGYNSAARQRARGRGDADRLGVDYDGSVGVKPSTNTPQKHGCQL